jgi:hypothetical protein
MPSLPGQEMLQRPPVDPDAQGLAAAFCHVSNYAVAY